MGDIITFEGSDTTFRGYFAPADGGGKAVIVIQEWWGLVPHICDVADRLARAGFTALAPDFYNGEATTEPDEAGKYMMALNLDEASTLTSAAIDYLLASPATTSATVGVVGFCMGGGLALVTAADQGDRVSACAPYYGLIPWPEAHPDWTKITAPVHGHYAENDGFFGPSAVAELADSLAAAGVEAELEIHPGVDHAFFNDVRPEVYNAGAATVAWSETLAFFQETIV